MEAHHNKEIAAIFRRMASVEGEHRDEIARRAGDALVEGRPASFSWTGPDGPEATDFSQLHYLMTPRQALRLARFNEERAVKYYEAVAEAATDPAIAAFAGKWPRTSAITWPGSINGWPNSPRTSRGGTRIRTRLSIRNEAGDALARQNGPAFNPPRPAPDARRRAPRRARRSGAPFP